MMSYVIRLSLFLLIPLNSLCGSSYQYVKLENKQICALNQFATQLAKEHGMRLLLTGTGSLVDAKGTHRGFSFIDDRLATIDQARPMVISMLKAFWKKFNEDPLFKTWMLYDDEKISYYDYAFAMKVSYWDQNNDRPLAPSLSQVRIAEDKISYYTASPKDQSLQLVHSESTVESLKIIDIH